MSRENRRSVRLLVNLLHIAVQAILLYVVIIMVNLKQVTDILSATKQVGGLALYLCAMFASYAIYVGLIRILTVYNRERITDRI